MPKFRKKPVEVEAIRYIHDGSRVVMDFLGGHAKYEVMDGAYKLVVPTLEGNLYASQGDWIIKGVKGKFYPCKPDIFEATYEAVYDQNQT